jgi:alpha/beta superfamily hydrolase
MFRRLVFSLVAALALPAFGQPAIDYVREERWAQEILPAIVVGDAVWLATASRPKVLAILTEPAATAKGGVVVVHGLGVHPDYGVAGALRTRLADAGFATLAVQMPVLASDAVRDDYAVALPEARERIAAAVAWLRAHGAAKIAIVAHSLGAEMANAYLARPGAIPVDAFVAVGMPVDFAARPREPVLDVVAERELAPVAAAAPLRAVHLPKDRCSQQLTIAGADHYFESRQKELAATIAAFLGRVFAGDC